ncbi:MAG: cytochrome c [Pseudomonadota bacterium]
MGKAVLQRMVFLLLGVTAYLAPSSVNADVPVDDGQAVFVSACAACHGMEAMGDGPTGALLAIDVPDLTRLAERSGGAFDVVRVIHTIDGRAGLTAHGGPMPMFGGLLTGPAAVIDAPDGTPVTTTEPILAIALWLETLQRAVE